MAGRVPGDIENLPSPTVNYIRRPTGGRSVASYCNRLNHIAGMRGLRLITAGVSTGFPLSTNDVPPTGAMTAAPRMRWVVSGLAQYVWWGGLIAADVDGSGSFLRVYLQTPGGVVVDGPIEFNRPNGRLPLRKFAPAPAPGDFLGASAGRDSLIHTGWSEDAAGGAPRLLDVGANQGQDLEIRVETNGVRVYSHFALEAYRVEP